MSKLILGKVSLRDGRNTLPKPNGDVDRGCLFD